MVIYLFERWWSDSRDGGLHTQPKRALCSCGTEKGEGRGEGGKNGVVSDCVDFYSGLSDNLNLYPLSLCCSVSPGLQLLSAVVCPAVCLFRVQLLFANFYLLFQGELEIWITDLS